MHSKTNLLEDYINFVDKTTKQKKYFKISIFLITIITVLLLFFVSFKYF